MVYNEDQFNPIGQAWCFKVKSKDITAFSDAYNELMKSFDFPGFVPAYIRPLFCEGKGPFRWVALSGDPEDIYKTELKPIIADGFLGTVLTQIIFYPDTLGKWIVESFIEIGSHGQIEPEPESVGIPVDYTVFNGLSKLLLDKLQSSAQLIPVIKTVIQLSCLSCGKLLIVFST